MSVAVLNLDMEHTLTNELVHQGGMSVVPTEGPLSKMMQAGHGVNAGAVAIESERAVAEARGQIQLAKMFPRSVTASITEFMDACKNIDFAESAFYSVTNRGTGPSIRFAEEAARCYGNFEYGHRELGRISGAAGTPGKSEIQVYAWDKEKNNFSPRQITVLHIMDKTGGAKILSDQNDIDNRIANVAARQMRGRILALLPKHMVAAGIAECKRTLAGGNDKPIGQRIIAMAQAFSKFGVTNTHLMAHLGHSVDDTTIDELADLMGIHNAIRDGAKASEYFDIEQKSDSAAVAAAITDQVRKGAEKKADKAEKKKLNQPDDEAAKSNPSESDRNGKEDSKPEDRHNTTTQRAQSAAAEKEQKPAEESSSNNQKADRPQAGEDVF